MSETILYTKENGIGKIVLNRPKSYNSFNREMAFAVQAALKDCQEDKAIRVVVLTGEGKAFCAGQDLVEVTSGELNPGFKAILEEHYNPIILAIRNLEKPVVAAVNGVAAGAGANIALACDIVVAADSASFIQAFSGIGLIPDSGGTYFLPRLVGFQKAVALAMLGDKISAAEAETMGMIYKAVPAEGFEEFVSTLATRLANMPTYGLALTKKAFQEGLNNSLEQQLAVEGKLQISASESEDYHEGVKAFIEKRKPVFKGK
jgi:2-(1,2-epoxy-1,2-dihydrophenyl)acetyl-CoA isomerase